MAGAPDVTLRDELPVSEFGGAVGGNIGQGRTSYFVSFDQFAMSRQRLLASLAADEN